MSNPPKAKGTGGEREVKRAAEEAGFTVDRMPPSSKYDLRIHAKPSMAGRSVNALATRPDAGRWLVTIPLFEFLDLLGYRGYGAHVEVKRYKRFVHHRIFTEKFGG